MPLETQDQQHLVTAEGYIELGMFDDANAEMKRLIHFVETYPKCSLHGWRFTKDCRSGKRWR